MTEVVARSVVAVVKIMVVLWIASSLSALAMTIGAARSVVAMIMEAWSVVVARAVVVAWA